jgi:hypothetical protein
MAVKIEVKQTAKKTKEVSYPAYKKNLSSDEVVLFFKSGTGVVIEPGKGGRKVFELRTDWNESAFSEVLEGYSVTFTSQP